MASVPEDLKYTKDHEWARQRDDVVVVGLTDHAQRQLGDVVYADLPKPGTSFDAGDPFGSVESVKAVSEVYAPVSGVVIKVNEEISESPENINTDPYGDGWLIELRMTDPAQASGLLTAAEYVAQTQSEEDS
ncbi:MAG TPA: glycine cleavage system protein GcvH [Pseudonocardiaceae bacterium]|nr:glycine cleavage system protein GcvH [Pseudonocardiaceae bacterium]